MEKETRDALSIDDKLLQLKSDWRAKVDKEFSKRKELDFLLNDQKTGAKTMYGVALKYAACGYVVDQLFRALSGYYQSQRRP